MMYIWVIGNRWKYRVSQMEEKLRTGLVKNWYRSIDTEKAKNILQNSHIFFIARATSS